MFVFKLITLLVCGTSSLGQLNYNNPMYVPEYMQTQSSYVAALQEPPTSSSEDDTSSDTTQTIQQLPTPDAPQPFFIFDPSTVLTAPNKEALPPNFNIQAYPVAPAPHLQLPSLVKWNPGNDPNLYYPIPERTSIPTNLYPKKYSKNLQKVKPIAFKIKESVSKGDAAIEQKKVNKLLQALAKQENKKLLESQKLPLVHNNGQEKVTDPIPAETGFSGSSAHGSLSHGGLANGGLSHGISDPKGERLEFHIAGHDGPKSYKWGYDTGKGHNRHFRYEERDKNGFVKGHYGFYDKHGKLRMVHYDSHPEEGFHASGTNFGHY